MSSPRQSLATLRPELGTFMELDLAAHQMGFVAGRVLPVLEVGVQAATFGKLKKEDLLQSRDTQRAPGSGYARQKHEFEEDSYACNEHGAEEPVDDRESQMYANYFDAEALAALRCRDVVLRNREKRVATAVFDTGTFNTTAAATAWPSLATATPIDDVEAAIKRLYLKGLKANTLLISWQVFRDLRNTTQIIDRISSVGAGDRTQPNDITVAKLAEVFDLPRIVVGDAIQNTANQGKSASFSGVWSNDTAAVMVTPMGQDIREPCLGRTMHWSADGSTFGGTIESYRDESVRSDIIRMREDTHEKLIYTDANELIDLTGP